MVQGSGLGGKQMEEIKKVLIEEFGLTEEEADRVAEVFMD